MTMQTYKGFYFLPVTDDLYTIYEDKGDHYRESASRSGGFRSVKKYIDDLIRKNLSTNCEY